MSSPPVDHSYLYKNEVSLSIGDDHPDTIIPTPFPRSFQENIPIIPEIENALSKKTLPKSPKDSQKMGLNNPGFETDQLKPRPLSSFGQNGSNEPINSINGKSFDPKSLRTEPVNLEMISLNKPTNGHENDLPVKKDTEVEVGGPYDEYFVPVNEHRKYMSVSFGNLHGNRGVDHSGHSLNETAHGIMDYKNWTKATRYPRDRYYPFHYFIHIASFLFAFVAGYIIIRGNMSFLTFRVNRFKHLSGVYLGYLSKTYYSGLK